MVRSSRPAAPPPRSSPTCGTPASTACSRAGDGREPNERTSRTAVAARPLIDVPDRLPPIASQLGVVIVVEALNRYESVLHHSVADVARVCRAVGSPSVRLMADLLHVNIEEEDPVEAALDSGRARPRAVGKLKPIRARRRPQGRVRRRRSSGSERLRRLALLRVQAQRGTERRAAC